MARERASVVWIDAAGATTATYITSDGGAGAVVTALAGHSRGAVQMSWEGPLVAAAAPAPTPGPYQSVRDAARLVYQTASGELVNITLPAPRSDIFLADGQTVDASKITDVTAAVVAAVVSAGGNPVTAFVAGYRQSTP